MSRKPRKSLHEMIVELSDTEKASRNIKNRVAFLSVMEEVRKEMENNWSMKQIWQALYLNGLISVSYSSFLNYVDRYIKTPRRRRHRNSKEPTFVEPDHKEQSTPQAECVPTQPVSSERTPLSWKQKNALGGKEPPKIPYFGQTIINEEELF